jgi:carbon storage regulator
MLVLSRKKDETIIINDQIEIRVLEVKGDTVRIGIVAPKEVKVYRKELFDAIVHENKQAGAASSNLAALKSLPLSKKPEGD